eukprot:1156504-Pelagomonas_calceolata.AAC.14
MPVRTTRCHACILRNASAELTPRPDDPGTRNTELLLMGTQPPLPAAAAAAADQPLTHRHPRQPPGGRRTRKPVKSRDRSMP